jgi:hypothetical protein
MIGSAVRFWMAVVFAVVVTAIVGSGQARATGSSLRVLHEGRQVQVLIPGASVVAVATGLAGRQMHYCLGLASLADRYGLPITLAEFRPGDDGVMLARAHVPLNVFPGEPAGPYILFAGRCTSVAPSGNFASTNVMIEPGLG